MSVRLALTAGIGRVADILAAVQPAQPIPRVPSLALGAFTWTPLELANAYAVFASGGVAAPLRFVRSVEREGYTVPVSEHAEVPVLDATLLAALDPFLRAPIQHPAGSAHALEALVLGIRGKTGTSNDARDAWFVGYTRDLLVAVWVGYDEPKRLRRRDGEETGGTLAVPIAAAVFRAAAARGLVTPMADPVEPDGDVESEPIVPRAESRGAGHFEPLQEEVPQ